MTRNITINGAALTAEQTATLEQLETGAGGRWPDGAYWYDARSGAAGAWGGPATGVLGAGHAIAEPMPANCSGGGTGVFVNGRELHVVDVIGLQQILGMVLPGRYWCDAQGNAGFEGGPPIVNMWLLAQQRRGGAAQGGGAWSHAQNYGGDRSCVGGDGNGFTYFMDSKGNSAYIG